MSSITKCRSCRREFEIPPENTGPEVRCPYCQAMNKAAVVRVQFEPRKLSPLKPVAAGGAIGIGGAESVAGAESLAGGPTGDIVAASQVDGSQGGDTANPDIPPVRGALAPPGTMPMFQTGPPAGLPGDGPGGGDARLEASLVGGTQDGDAANPYTPPVSVTAPMLQTGVLPHRGPMILTQAIITCVLATVGGAICTPVFLIAIVIGIVVIYNARKDLKQMAAGTMDRSGHALTWIGMSLAIGGVVIVTLIIGGFLVAAFVFMAEGRGWIK